MEAWIRHVYIIVLKSKYPVEDINIVQTGFMTYAAYKATALPRFARRLSIEEYIIERNK